MKAPAPLVRRSVPVYASGGAGLSARPFELKQATPLAMPSAPKDVSRRVVHFLSNLFIVAIIRLARLLPYEYRVRAFGGLVQHVIGPLAGYRRRALANLALIYPDMPETERRHIATRCLNNVGRTLIEFYSADEFLPRMAKNELQGPGFAALEAASAEKRPVLLVGGHYGNFEAVRAALVARGFPVGGFYRNMANPFFNEHYVRAVESFGGPGFAQSRKGTTGFVRHLKSGGLAVFFLDQHVMGAPALDFMGEPARTSLSAAELTLRFDAVLIPFYGIRNSDGVTFTTVLEAPIAHTDPETMTQQINDSLAARVQQDPSQWFWVHRRWRAEE
jgi:KDO2-lipid IV(A) lauroyltransferase